MTYERLEKLETSWTSRLLQTECRENLLAWAMHLGYKPASR